MLPKSTRALFWAVTTALCLLTAPPGAAAPLDVDGLLRQADQDVQAGKFNPAREAYEKALGSGAPLGNDYARARNLGVCYLNGNPPDYAKAVRWLNLALGLRPAAEDVRLLLAQALLRNGNYSAEVEHQASLSMLESYLERNPSDTNMRLEYARLLGYARKFPEALTQYHMVLMADPNNVGAQVGVAKITAWQSDQQTALELYDKILKRHPDLYDALVGKAFTLLWMGRRNEAQALLVNAAQRNPGDKEVQAALKSLGESVFVEEPPPAAASASRRTSGKSGRAPRLGAPATLVGEAGLAAGPRSGADPSRSAWLRHWPVILVFVAGGVLAYFTFKVKTHTPRLQPRTVPQLLPASSAVVVAEAPQPAAAPPVPRTENPEAQLRGRILLVDDEEAVLEFEREVLSAAGAEVVALSRAQDALVRLEADSFDAVIVDGKLSGGCTGMDLYRWLLYNRPGAEKKLMLTLSNLADPEVKLFVQETGVLCLIRPFGVPDLVVMTRLLLQKSRVLGAFQNYPTVGAPLASPSPPLTIN